MCGRDSRVVSDVFGAQGTGDDDDGGRAMLISGGGVGLVGMMMQLVMGRAPLTVSVVSVAPTATVAAEWQPGADAFPFYVPADWFALDRANTTIPATDWLPERPLLSQPLAAVTASAKDELPETDRLDSAPVETVATDLVNESTVAPEPATLWLLASGLIALGVTGLLQRRRYS